MHTHRSLHFVALLVSGLTGTSAWAQRTPTAHPAPAHTVDVAAVVHGNTQFALDLYARLRTTPGNVAFSPASLSLALAMTYGGARGDTATAMAHTLHFPSDASAVHSGFQTLLAQWAHPTTAGTYQLDIANRLYGEQTTSFLPQFMALTRDQYGAPLDTVDWIHHSEEVRVELNTWVAQQTHDRIRDLVPANGVSSATRLALVNAVYFHGAWEHGFRPGDTRTLPFHVTTRDSVDAAMMSQHGSFQYAHVGPVQIVEMPYRGGDLAFDLVLPDARDGLSNVEAIMDTATVERWLSSLGEEEIDLKLPRFRTASTVPATTVLRAMGMQLAFDASHADFSGMAQLPAGHTLSISDVFHKAFVDVNEEGTEAAAATAVVMSEAAAIQRPPAQVVADHPFLFLLRDRRSGTVIFMGRVATPAA